MLEQNKLMQNLKATGLCFLKIFVYWLKIGISFYKVKWQNSLKAELLMRRNRLMNTFIIVKRYPQMYGIYSSWDKSMLFHSKKVLLFPSVLSGTQYTWALIWKKSLIICFESYQGIPYLFPYRQSRQEFEYVANGYILTLYCKR